MNVVSIGELNDHRFLGTFLEKICKERNLTCHHVDIIIKMDSKKSLYRVFTTTVKNAARNESVTFTI
jgi:hypothetical protein